MGENAQLKLMYAQRFKLKRKLSEYYLGELDKDDLEEIGRKQFYKKLLKNEIETYIESDDKFIETNLRIALQEEKVHYIESIIRSINNRGFQIKNAVDWIRFKNGN
jgi:hypothetical protein